MVEEWEEEEWVESAAMIGGTELDKVINRTIIILLTEEKKKL